MVCGLLLSHAVGYTKWKNKVQLCKKKKKEENWPTQQDRSTVKHNSSNVHFYSPTLSAFHNTLCQMTPSPSISNERYYSGHMLIVQIWLVRPSQCECTGIYTHYSHPDQCHLLCLNQPQHWTFILPVSFLVSFPDSMRMRLVSFQDHIVPSMWGRNDARHVGLGTGSMVFPIST